MGKQIVRKMGKIAFWAWICLLSVKAVRWRLCRIVRELCGLCRIVQICAIPHHRAGVREWGLEKLEC